MSKNYQRHRFCDAESEYECSKRHYGLELEITFNNQKNRDLFFDQLKQFLLSSNINDKIIDRLDFSKIEGGLGNVYTEDGQYGMNSNRVAVSGNKGGWVKPLFEDVPP